MPPNRNVNLNLGELLDRLVRPDTCFYQHPTPFVIALKGLVTEADLMQVMGTTG